MNITPQQSSPTPGYPAHRGLTPLRAAIIASLACSVSACHDEKTLPAPQTSQPVTQEKKVVRHHAPQKQTRSIPCPVAPEPISEEIIEIADGEIAVEPMYIKGRISSEPAQQIPDRGTIIEITPDTPSNEP